MASLKKEFDAAEKEIVTSDFPMVADSGSEMIHFRKINAQTQEVEKDISYNLSTMSVQPGDQYIVNAEKLPAILKSLVDNKIFDSIYCQ